MSSNQSEENRVREWMQLYIRRLTDERKMPIEVPPDMLAHQMLTEIMQDGVLPHKDNQGIAMLWEMHNQRTQKKIELERSIGEQCQNDDVLDAASQNSGGAYEQTRLLRVKREIEQLQELAQSQHWFGIEATTGNSAVAQVSEAYLLSISCKGISSVSQKPDGSYISNVATSHQAYLYLRHDYPSDPPLFFMKTPCFHPNIRESDGAICIKEATSRYRPGYSLRELVECLWAMISYQTFDPTDFFNAAAVIFALTSPQQIAAIGGQPFLEEAANEARVRQYLSWLAESDRKGDFWALKCWLSNDPELLVPAERGVRYPDGKNWQ